MNWPLMPLGEVLQEVTRPTVVQPTDSYRMLGVRLDNCGPFLRETVTGGEISAKTVWRVEAGDFIYSRLFAWRGAFGIISPELNGCFVSNEFPTYLPAMEVLVEFVALWFRLPQSLREVEVLCTGSTPLTRNRLKEEAFASLKIPLPPLIEQRKLVDRIGAIEKRIEEQEKLLSEVREGYRYLTAHWLMQLKGE
jgi:type I restriction enzyme S subunit